MFASGWNNGYGPNKGLAGIGTNLPFELCYFNMGWNTSTYPEYAPSNLECRRKKVVGEPDEGKPHVRFDVAGDENQDKVIALSTLKRNGEQQAAATYIPGVIP